MSKESIIISYDGEALKEHSIDVHELIFALSGICDIFQTTNKLVNKDSSIDIKVTAFNQGSFEIGIDVIHHCSNIINMFNSNDINGALNLLEILGLTSAGCCGVLQLIKKIKDGKIESIENNQDGSININVNINGEKSSISNVSRDTYNVYINPNVLSGFDKAFKPLQDNKGIDKLEIKQNNISVEILNKQEALDFKEQLNQGKDLTEFETEVFLNIISPVFKDDKKWKFADGSKEFFATILDDIFLGLVDSGQVAFGKGDILKVRLKTKQSETPDMKIKTEYEILKIISHKRFDQLRLFE